jgi:hypothetical protein
MLSREIFIALRRRPNRGWSGKIFPFSRLRELRSSPRFSLTVLELRGLIFQGTESHTVRDGEDPPQRPMGVHSAHGMHVGICVPWLQDPDP